MFFSECRLDYDYAILTLCEDLEFSEVSNSSQFIKCSIIIKDISKIWLLKLFFISLRMFLQFVFLNQLDKVGSILISLHLFKKNLK